ncbi:hypothetical protein LTR97_001761 [Elasticomyces elasticus]|uniref:Uncharacterized protein n=1 Tax=Elasticomyces elasticus TaxID=574655 RepID=A0AAN7VXG1_9PEZI|nr:hypothetical protein LTR97_001761 [Elasticomyces elasticus]
MLTKKHNYRSWKPSIGLSTLPDSKPRDALVAWVTSPGGRDHWEELATAAAIEAERREMVRFEQELERINQ